MNYLEGYTSVNVFYLVLRRHLSGVTERNYRIPHLSLKIVPLHSLFSQKITKPGFDRVTPTCGTQLLSAKLTNHQFVFITLPNKKFFWCFLHFTSQFPLILGWEKLIGHSKIFISPSFWDILYVEVLHFKNLRENCKYHLHMVTKSDLFFLMTVLS